ncbi:MAG: hypothetical protein V3W44_09670 [Dehalococcoidales bacterium]
MKKTDGRLLANAQKAVAKAIKGHCLHPDHSPKFDGDFEYSVSSRDAENLARVAVLVIGLSFLAGGADDD